MSKASVRTYSRYTLEAIALLGRLVRAARKERVMTAQELADRAGISRGLLQRIEKGDPKCELGATLEVATLVGVRLFDADADTLSSHMRLTEEKLALLPKTVRNKGKEPDDDF